MTLSVVVESKTAASLVRAILGKELAGKLQFFATDGRIAPATVGRNILVHEGGPVLLVLDSNTRSPRLVEERKSLAFLATSGVAQPDFPRLNDWVKVFLFVPEIEVVFFEAPQSLEGILGQRISESTVQEGSLAPNATLEKLLAEGQGDYQALVASLNSRVANALATGGQAMALKATVESMMIPAVSL
jgi:hypothetical protein